MALTATDNDVEGLRFVKAPIEEGRLEKYAVLLLHDNLHVIVVDIPVAAATETTLYGVGICRGGTEVVGSVKMRLYDGFMTGNARMAVIGGCGRLRVPGRGNPLRVDPAGDGGQGDDDGTAART